MPLYDYRCPDGHRVELVRPMGTDTVACPSCDGVAYRSRVHHFDVVGPTVDTRGMARRFVEAHAEREHEYSKAEAAVGNSIERPNDWAVPEARAAARVERGEVNPATIKALDYQTYKGGSL